MPPFSQFKTNCKTCNKEISKKRCYEGRFVNFFCNRECQNIFNRNNKTLQGTQRKPWWKHTKQAKKKIGKASKGNKYCVGNVPTLEARINHSKAMTGGKEPFWLYEGKNIKGYTQNFNKQLKERVRVRDNFICQLCGVPELEFNRKLDIHHKDNNKENCSIDNLVTLCRSCHMKTKFKSFEELSRKVGVS
jgi:hypothetical protein